MPESTKVEKNKKYPIEIDMTITGTEECIRKMELVTEYAERLEKAVKSLNNLTITIITTREEQGEGIERQKDKDDPKEPL